MQALARFSSSDEPETRTYAERTKSSYSAQSKAKPIPVTEETIPWEGITYARRL